MDPTTPWSQALKDRSPAPMLSEKLDAIRKADWNFLEVERQRPIHRIHPYPAKFIPQIPDQLIRLLRPENASVIFDPFCGSGTTLVEAQRAGHPAIGIDVNPIAALISRVKTRPSSRPILPTACEAIRTATKGQAPIPFIPRLDHWFERDVQRALAGLVAAIEGAQDEAMREALKVALSSIIVRVSNQDGDTRYAAIKKNVSAELVYDLFKSAASDLDKAHNDAFGGLFRNGFVPVKVITKDILQTAPADVGWQVGLVITSPPYPNAYEYWLYHKYRMYWLGMDPLAVRSAEIGARPHYFKKNHKTAADFEREMTKLFALLASVMLPDAIACFVVGRSIIHGRTIDNVDVLERAGLTHGFRRLLVVDREIPPTRKAFNPAHGTITAEALVVFGR